MRTESTVFNSRLFIAGEKLSNLKHILLSNIQTPTHREKTSKIDKNAWKTYGLGEKIWPMMHLKSLEEREKNSGRFQIWREIGHEGFQIDENIRSQNSRKMANPKLDE